MKLSTRKELLNEAEQEMRKIRNELNNVSSAPNNNLLREFDYAPVITGVATLAGYGLGAIIGNYLAMNPQAIKHPIETVKKLVAKFKSDRQMAPIINKLEQDPEIVKAVKNKNYRNLNKLIQSKLTPEEMKVVGSRKLVRSDFDV